MARGLVLALMVLLAGLVAGCPRTDQSLVLVGGQRVDAARIDGDPLGLLPAGALVIGTLDARALFATPLGAQMGEITKQLVPLGPESRFVAARDVTRIVGAVYAAQGADFCAVIQGTFDPVAIEQAAQAKLATPSGAPLVATAYAGYSIYTVANLGFVVLTSRTVLSGSETGMRRALDRLRFGRLAHDLEPWMDELLRTEGAAFVAVGNVGKQGVIDAAGPALPFVKDMKLVRVLGNFKPPGMNLVGSATYADPAAAALGAESAGRLREISGLLSLLAAFGLGAQIPVLDVQQQGSDVAFATSADTGFMQLVLATIAQTFRPPAQGSGWIGG